MSKGDPATGETISVIDYYDYVYNLFNTKSTTLTEENKLVFLDRSDETIDQTEIKEFFSYLVSNNLAVGVVGTYGKDSDWTLTPPLLPNPEFMPTMITIRAKDIPEVNGRIGAFFQKISLEA